MTVTAPQTAAKPTLARSSEQFAEEVAKYLDEYVEDLERIRRAVEETLQDYSPAYGDEALRAARHKERIKRAGAEQLIRYVSQEIDQGGLPRHMEVRLGVRLAELEAAVSSTQEYVQGAKRQEQPTSTNAASSTADKYYDIDGGDLPF